MLSKLNIYAQMDILLYINDISLYFDARFCIAFQVFVLPKFNGTLLVSLCFFLRFKGFLVPVNTRFRLRLRVVFAPVSFSIVFVFVFVSGVSVFVSASGKKYKNTCGSTQFRPFPLRFHT